MFRPATLRVAAVIAMTLSVLGLLLSLVLVRQSGSFILPIISWALLLWASFLGFRLSSYQLYEAEYKKVGFRIYLIIVAFFLFFFVGFAVGLGLAVVLLAALWGLKRNYDEWVPTAPEAAPNSDAAPTAAP